MKPVNGDIYVASCTLCDAKINIAHSGHAQLKKHEDSSKHQELTRKRKTQCTLISKGSGRLGLSAVLEKIEMIEQKLSYTDQVATDEIIQEFRIIDNNQALSCADVTPMTLSECSRLKL